MNRFADLPIGASSSLIGARAPTPEVRAEFVCACVRVCMCF